MGGTNGQDLCVEFSHCLSREGRPFVGVEAGRDAATAGQGPCNLSTHPLRRPHHPWVGKEEAVFRWGRTGPQMGEEGLLCTEHLHCAGRQLCQAIAPPCSHAKPCGQHGTNQGAQARKVCFSEGVKGGLKAIQSTLYLDRCSTVVPKAAPLGASREVDRSLETKVTSKTAQIIGFTKRSSRAHAVTVQVQVGKEKPEPFDQAGHTNVAGHADLLHRTMQMFESAVKIARCVSNPTLRQSNGRLVKEAEVLLRWFGQRTLADRFHGGFRKAFEKLGGLGRQTALPHALKPFHCTLHSTTATPSKSIDFNTVRVDENRDVPIVKEAHVGTSRPWAKTLRS